MDLARGETVRLMEHHCLTGEQCLITETSDSFVKLAHNDATPELHYLPASNELIWFSERSGWAHLYLYDLDTGELKHPITQGDWLVRHILQVDTERRELICCISAAAIHAINPHYRHIFRVNIDTGAFTDIATGNYEYSLFSDSYGRQAGARAGLGVDSAGLPPGLPDATMVTTRSRVDTAPVSVLLNRQGEELLTLETADPQLARAFCLARAGANRRRRWPYRDLWKRLSPPGL